MVRFRFQLMAMGDMGVKYIDCDPTLRADVLKAIVRREYQLNRALSIQFLFKGAVIPENFTLAMLEIRPAKDVIVVYAYDLLCSEKLPHIPKRQRIL